MNINEIPNGNKTAFLEVAKQLRLAAEQAQDRFIAFLMDGERRKDIWLNTNMTYPEFLESCDLCKASWYMRVRRVADNVGEEQAAKLPKAAFAPIARLSPQSQKLATDELLRVVEVNGVKPSDFNVRKIISDYQAREQVEQPPKPQRHQAYTSLEAEVLALRAENVKLLKENDKLREENKILRAELAGRDQDNRPSL